MSLIFFTVFAACACFVKGQTTCATPSGGSGECISVFNCQELLTVLNRVNSNTHTSQDVDLLKNSQCGFQGSSPAVCCPKVSQLTQLQSGKCTTPEGNVGECVNLYSCSHLVKLLNPPLTSENIAYVRSTVCQGTDPNSVCCGLPPAPDRIKVVKPSVDCASEMTAYPPDPRTECCGIDSSSGNKIYGGNETALDQYPWLAIIEYTRNGELQSLQCGGTLISGKYVLTAAHCIAGSILTKGTPKRVILAEHNRTNDGPDCVQVNGGGTDCSDGVTRILIEKFIAHPQYLPANSRNDIGLIRLAQTAPFTEFIRPVCLPSIDVTDPRNIPSNFTLYTAGWGAVSFKKGSSDVKQHVDLPYVTNEICQPAYRVIGRNIQLGKSQLCAGGVTGKDSCKGDSGGPLMYEDGVTYQIIGIVSFGPTPCGIDGVPGVYSKVYEYLDWIRSTIVP